MPTLIASGTLTADGTEQDLATSTSNNIYVLKVDTGLLINGETVELRAYTKCLSGGTERLAFMAVYVNTQGEPMKYLRVAENISLRLTLKQTVMVTAYKAFPWALLAVLDAATFGAS